ncbi:hypothetical protein PF010_g29136 [Phytophthora fragariae]|nr:hypothetical protein PF009_g28925 [Phytophthora fragariae]KAE8967450.1 hypothetical protein PF011_g27556 [Phytophthora fragariae]KAE9063096.1 hypothetical protein PF010_g29136 [Phytophthora fragariae]KAE9066418.1 hypothetical protein PF007_g28482 [Phytophthora fragariae]KAE9168161.1 hypothetical protein PF004_g28592 [Phytophthora fragariae]
MKAFQPFAEAMDEAQFLTGKRFKQPMWYCKSSIVLWSVFMDFTDAF